MIELEVSADSARVLVSAAGAAESRQGKKARVAALLSDSPASHSQFAAAAGLSHKAAKSTLEALVAEGRASEVKFQSKDKIGRTRSLTGYRTADSRPTTDDPHGGGLGVSLRQIEEQRDWGTDGAP